MIDAAKTKKYSRVSKRCSYCSSENTENVKKKILITGVNFSEQLLRSATGSRRIINADIMIFGGHGFFNERLVEGYTVYDNMVIVFFEISFLKDILYSRNFDTGGHYMWRASTSPRKYLTHPNIGFSRREGLFPTKMQQAPERSKKE
uniref:Uncharacterized protein n=1 Tax=Romanomermis culicivorax TaxID=13658 RepID=A0A915HFH5_ROMCU